ncbi:MAG: SH3 domain-containing protein [Rhodobacter sp.]|nr:SH3 domain-containing protein [Paracoccaceae bacterium]MCB1410213.1 SH3 domain-containing protein [Paracoccaceae bacterium]MCC0081168.1 SH3 domain-containing protein [Rhodobacter sp.]
MIARVLVLLVALCAAQTALAQDFPALHQVTGVATNDVLNIRAEPSARASIIGSFAPSTTDIEVIGLSEDRGWGLVRVLEGGGWVSMRYMVRQGTDRWIDGTVPMTCAGTEPFWTLAFHLPTNGADFSSPDGGFSLVTDAPDLPRTLYPRTLALPFAGARQGFAVVRQGLCSDGMSDLPFGLEVQVYWRGGAGGALSGCCRLGH